MLFLSSNAKNKLIEHRKNCLSLVKNVVNQFKIGYDDKMIPDMDLEMSKSIGTTNKSSLWISWFIRRLYYGRVKNDWNETMRLYDVPVDEFHLDDKHEEQLQLSYTYK